MTPEHSLAFLGFAIVLAGTPGPSNAVLTATGAKVGVVRGLPSLAGVVVGMAVLMFVTVFGLGALILEKPLLVTAVRWTGVAVLLWVAWGIARARGSGVDQDARPIGFVGAAAFQWINPKSWLACASAAAAFFDQSRGGAHVQAAMLAVLFALAALPSCFVWLAFGALVQRALRSERAVRTFNLVMGAVLAASVVLLLAPE